jgi:hypothetical protein
MELYRYEKRCYDENLKSNGISNVEVVCNAYIVVKETLMFYVIQLHSKKLKRVRKNAHSAWANVDKNKALKDFIRRCHKSIRKS